MSEFSQECQFSVLSTLYLEAESTLLRGVWFFLRKMGGEGECCDDPYAAWLHLPHEILGKSLV